MQVWHDCLFVLTKGSHQLLYASHIKGLQHKITLKPHPAFEDCRVKKLIFGATHMFILTDEGVVFTLGDNHHGQQGIPSSTVINDAGNSSIADRVHQISLVTFFFERGIKVEDVACGDNFTMFVTKEGIFGAGSSLNSEMGS